MVVPLGGDAMTYQAVEGWAKLPQGWLFKECADVAIDSKDRVYVFNRGEHPIIIFDRDGNFLDSWGEGVFKSAHGICVGPDDSVYCVDNGDHTVRKLSPEGKLLMTLGTKDHPSPWHSGEPFNLPTGLAVSQKTGDLFISDGYGNARIHRYSSDGRHIMSWGGSGIEPGNFVIPHNIAIDKDDNIYVADRECHRVQIFDATGRLQSIWRDIWKPAGIRIGSDGKVYIAELLADEYYRDAPNVGHMVSVYSPSGELLVRLGDPEWGENPGQFVCPHGIALDSQDSIYVAEVSWTMAGRTLSPPREMRSLQKLAKS